jgi:rubrerythrin
MPSRSLDPHRFDQNAVENNLSADANADWHGNNAAFACPVCTKIFIVSNGIKPNPRHCPGCGKSKAEVTGSPRDPGKIAKIEWED